MPTRGASAVAESPSERREEPSVFRTPDQAEMIARLDAVEDDDIDSSFFATSARDAEDAAVRIFDVGIRTLAAESGAVAGFAERPAAEAPVEPRAPRVVGGVDFDDPATRTAFILGGPDALPTVG